MKLKLRNFSVMGRAVLALLSLVGAFGHSGETLAKSPSPETADAARLQARMEHARNRLIQEFGTQLADPKAAAKLAQWYNWGNWGNWYNGWRNW